MTIQNFEDFKPRSAPIQVGAETLQVEELVAVKRDALIRLVMDEIDIVRLFGPFMRGLRKDFGFVEENKSENDDGQETDEKADEVFNEDFDEVFVNVKKSVMNILGKSLTKVSCIVLDTEKNRRIVGVESVDCKPDDDGIMFYENMHNWVKENLTMRQEQGLIKTVISTNDFVGLVKNYITLVMGTARVIGQEEEK